MRGLFRFSQDFYISPKLLLLLLGLVSSICYAHYATERAETALLVVLSLCFGFYFALLRVGILSPKLILVIGVLIRTSLFFSWPNLSDDFYRFIWDGEMLLSGIHPFSMTPEMFMNSGQAIEGATSLLYDKLNSQTYFTIYPPLSQYIYALSAWVSKDLFVQMSVLRSIILLFEIGSMVLIYQLLGPNKKRLMIYAFNPLVILELTGNLHFEGLIVFFLLLAVWWFSRHQQMLAASALGFGILAKLTPLMFLPLLVNKLGFRQAIASYLLIAILVLGFSYPLIDLDLLVGMSKSLSLFFQHFEFNAGLFFLFRSVGFYLIGYDVVHTLGPVMSLISLTLIVGYALLVVDRNTPWAKAFTVVLFIQLLFATTVHPWYIVPLVAMSVFTGYLFPLIWSYLIFFTYLGYSSDGFQHPFWWIALEYTSVIALVYVEVIKKKPLLFKLKSTTS